MGVYHTPSGPQEAMEHMKMAGLVTGNQFSASVSKVTFVFSSGQKIPTLPDSYAEDPQWLQGMIRQGVELKVLDAQAPMWSIAVRGDGEVGFGAVWNFCEA